MLASLLLHGTLLCLVASGLNSCGDRSLTLAEGEYREVGIYVKNPESASERGDPQDQPTEDTSKKDPFSADAFQNTPPRVEASPPVELQIPRDDLPAVIELDAATIVLTSYGRINAGTIRGDREVADRFLNSFFRI